jgi:multidrug efflux pump subunit AcrB
MRTILSLLGCVALGCLWSKPEVCVYPAEPEPSGPVLRVTADYPGANAKVVAKTVAAPIEEQLNGTEGLTLIESESRDDGSYVATLRFTPKTAADEVTRIIRKRIDRAQPQLPEEVRRQGVAVQASDVDRFPPLWLAVWKREEADLATLAKTAVELKDAMARVPGVRDSRVMGQPTISARLWLEADKLAARSLTRQDVLAALGAQNLRPEAPGGKAKDINPLDPEQWADIVVKELGGGRFVRLKDVGKVELRVQEEAFSRFNDRPAVLIAVVPADAKALDAATGTARKAFEKFPKGLSGEVVADATSGWSLVELRWPTDQRDGLEKLRGNVVVTRKQAEKFSDAVKRVRELSGSPKCLAFAEDEETVARLLVKVAAKDQPALRNTLTECSDVSVRISDLVTGRAFPVRIALTDQLRQTDKKLREWAAAVAQRLAKEGVAVDPDAFPRMQVQINSTSRFLRQPQWLDFPNIANVLGISVGSGSVSDVSIDDQLSDFRVQTDAKAAKPLDLKKLTVRTSESELVSLSEIARLDSVKAPPEVLRVNRYPAIRITADIPQGKSIAEATAKCAEIAETVRKEMKLPDTFVVVNLTK